MTVLYDSHVSANNIKAKAFIYEGCNKVKKEVPRTAVIYSEDKKRVLHKDGSYTYTHDSIFAYSATQDTTDAADNIIMYNSHVNAPAQLCVALYGSTITGANLYEGSPRTYKGVWFDAVAGKGVSATYTLCDLPSDTRYANHSSIALYDSTLNDDLDTMKLWNNSVTIKPYGFVNNIALYSEYYGKILLSNTDVRTRLAVNTNNAVLLVD